MSVHAGRKDTAVFSYLQNRRSAKIDQLADPGPDAQQLQDILEAAIRVPDHGRLCPWYFVIFDGAARQEFGDILARIHAERQPEATAEQVERERSRLLRAPVVVAVVSRIRRGKPPLWEQILSAGALCMNLSLAAHAQGFGVTWVTEWLAYDEDVRAAMGLDARDHVAGFLYIGTCKSQPEERERPPLPAITTHWRPRVTLNKGDALARDGFDFPAAGFDFSKLPS